MDIEQQKAFTLYENKQKELEKMKENRKKILNSQLKQLNCEIVDILKSFDVEVSSLAIEKIQSTTSIYMTELISLFISYQKVHKDYIEMKISKLDNFINSANNELKHTNSDVSRFRIELEKRILTLDSYRHE